LRKTFKYLEKRIIGCMGLEYAQGISDCPDSMPEEEVCIKNQQNVLAA